MPFIPPVTFNNGVEIPQIGFGVFLVPDAETKQAVSSALDVGYRHIDELFITTKCWNSDQGYDEARGAFDASVDRLGLDYVDLYLIHWPVPSKDRYVDTWRAFEKLYADGRVRAIGVSNFQPPHVQRLLDETEVVPAINQVELHPWLQQREVRAFDAEHGIVTEAWSPIARGGDHLDNPSLKEIADKHSVTPAQVILRWHLDLGNVIIPKSVNKDRMAANLDLFRIRLDEDDHAKIDALDEGHRVGPNPDNFSAG